MARKIGIALATLVVALVLAGQLEFLVQARNAESSRKHTLSALPASAPFSARLDAVLDDALGASDRGVQRYRVTRITTDPAYRSLKDVDVTWAINNDLANGTVGNGAQADAYYMFRELFSSLPLEVVRLRGTYATSPGEREQTVMRLWMDRKVAGVIGKAGWDNFDPQTVWPMIHRVQVDADFQPQSSD